MDWTLVSVIVLSALALMPIFFLLRLVTLRIREQRLPFEQEQVSAGVYEAGPDPLETPSWSSTGTSASRMSRPQQEVSPKLKRIARLSQHTDAVAGVPLYVFDYTIRRHTGATRQALPNLGGFTQVPFVLRDRMGHSFTVHRRLCLN